MKRLLAAFLPSESREHVLGDLAQRGYRWADILSVLPRVWFSHACRLWNGPIPSLAAASESQVRHRARQFARRRLLVGIVGSLFFLGYWFDKYSTRHPDWSATILLVLCTFWIAVAIAGVAYYRSSQRTTPPTREGSLESHRKQLLNAIRYLQQWLQLFCVCLFISNFRADVIHLMWLTSALIIILVIRRHRLRRLRAELVNLPNEPSV